MSSHEMARLGGFANLSAENLARLCFVNVRTARRWKRAHMAPRLAVEWLELVHDGHLSKIDAKWSEWCLRGGTLGNIHGWQFTMHEVMAIPFLHSTVSAYRVEVRKLRDQLKQLQAALLRPVVHTFTVQNLPATSLGLGLNDLAALRQPIAFLQSTSASTTGHD